MGKLIAFLLLFGMFIFIFQTMSAEPDDGVQSQKPEPRVVTIKRDRALETGIDRTYVIDRDAADDWGTAH